MKLIVTDFGDPNAGLALKTWVVEAPFELGEADNVEVFRKSIENIYGEFANGRLSADYDYELEYASQLENDLKPGPELSGGFASFNEYLQSVVSEMKQFTARNNHTEALIKLARFLSDKEAYSQLIGLQKQTASSGINETQLDQRKAIRENLLRQVMEKHGKSTYRLLYGSL